MATTFTLNYSGQEINNRLARIDNCLAKTTGNIDYLQNENNFKMGNNQSQFVFDTSLGTTGTVLTLSTDSVERTYNGTTTHLDWTNIVTRTLLNNYLERGSNAEYDIGYYQGYFYINLYDRDPDTPAMIYHFGNSDTTGFNIAHGEDVGSVNFRTDGIDFTTTSGTTTSIDYSNIATKTDAAQTYLAKHVSNWNYGQSTNGFELGRNLNDPDLGPVDEYMELEMRSTDDTDATGVGLTQLPTLQLSTTLINNPNYSDEYDISAYINALGIKTIRGESGSETINYIPFKNIVNSTNLKTINNVSLIGTGNIQVAADVESITNAEIEALFVDVTLISFTFKNTTYQAESGMTWQEWVNSSYNTKGFKIEDYEVKTSSSIYVVADGDHNPVSPSSSIIANYSYQYTVSYVPGGGSN